MSERGVSAPSLKSSDFTHSGQVRPVPWVSAQTVEKVCSSLMESWLSVLSSRHSRPFTSWDQLLKIAWQKIQKPLGLQ